MFLMKYDKPGDTHCSNLTWFTGQVTDIRQIRINGMILVIVLDKLKNKITLKDL